MKFIFLKLLSLKREIFEIIISSGNNKHIIKTDGIREHQQHSNYKAN